MTTVALVIKAVGDFLKPIMPANISIAKGQQNNVPMMPAPLLVMTPIGMPQYPTTRMSLDSTAGKMAYDMPKILKLQMDFYGKDAGEMSNRAATMLRSLYASEQFPEGIFPLYCDDAIQSPLTTAEKQYEDRWTTTLSLQYNSPVLINQESFNALGEVNADPTNVTTP